MNQENFSCKKEQEEFPQLQLQIDPLKSSCHHKLTLENIPILFPQKPYAVQQQYMKSVIQALNAQSNALYYVPLLRLQSPTGTGKTLALLCATLAWISQSKRKIRIIYSSRTHSQLKQVAHELSKTAYKPRVSMLGSRKHLCINDEIHKLDETKLNKQCNKLRKHNACQYHDTDAIEQAAKVLKDKILDIEELKSFCRNDSLCPFYLEKQRNINADILLLPYNYLLTMKLKGYINLENSIIIFDEAHNVVQAAEDGQSFSLSQESIQKGHQKLDKWTDEMNDLGVAHQEYKNPSQLIKIAYDLKWFYNHLNELLNMHMFKSNYEHCQSFDGRQIIKIISYYFSESNKDTNYLAKLFYHNQAQGLTEQEIQHFQACCSNLNLQIKYFKKHSGTHLNNILSFVGRVNKIFNHTKLMQNESQLVDSYKLFIEKAEKQMHLSMTCLDPSIGFSHLIDQRVYSIIITSGTLTPFDSWPQELDIQFNIPPLENAHLDGITNNVKGFVLKEYNFSYRHRNNDEQLFRLGQMIYQLCDVVPAGLLVVFSSYQLMNSIKFVWNQSNILNGIHLKKSCYWEPPNAQNLQGIFSQYQTDARSRGAILFCVQRGKVSEGIDFSDELCRAVFLVGVPYLPSHEVKVIEKKKFIDKQQYSLTGSAWYAQQATRAINQALGRVIRHKMDYGAIFLCDSRFQTSNLSKWVQPSVQKIIEWRPVHTIETQAFFKQKEFQYSQGQNDLQKKIKFKEQL